MTKIILKNTKIKNNARCVFNPPAVWTPDIFGSSLHLWLDAQDDSTIILNGSNVAQWSDKSSYDRHASTTTASFQPLYQNDGLNNKPSLIYSIDQRLQLATDISIVENMTIFSVFRRNTSDIWSITLGGNNINGRPHGLIWGTTNFIYNGLGLGTLDETNFGNNTEFGNFISEVNRTPTNAQVWLNANQFRNTKQSLVSDGTLRWVGRRPAQSHDGALSEIILIKKELDLNEKQKMEGYLAHRWGLTNNLPSNHPYKNEIPRL
jgi:hypothetical protein